MWMVTYIKWIRFNETGVSSKTAHRILTFSIVLGAEYSFYVKSIATNAPQKVDIVIHS